jgi:hypothetical protein
LFKGFGEVMAVSTLLPPDLPWLVIIVIH